MTEPCDFNFYNFLGSNADDLKRFSRDVNVLSASALTQLQRLPVTMRRRAASHNAKRLPFRFRKLATVSAARKVVKTCRKYKRRHTNVKAVFALRQSKNKWLCTHIWHAKRFKMENRWGWKIPIIPNQKTFRPCTKAMTDGCCVVDLSYYSSYELYGHLNTVMEGMKMLISKDDTDEIVSVLTAGREVSCVLYKPGEYPYGAICPLKMILVGDTASTSSMILTVHPTASSQFLAVLTEVFHLANKQLNKCWANDTSSIILIDRGGATCRYRLLGYDSHVILTTVFGESADLSRLIEWPMNKIRSGYSIEVSVTDPERYKPKLKETDVKQPLRRPWRIPSSLPAVVMAPSFLQVSQDVRQQLVAGETVGIDQKNLTKPPSEDDRCVVRITRERHGGNSPGGWDLEVECKWAMKVWMTLIMKGARPMGLRYWTRYCAVEASSLKAKADCFPLLGWPDTEQGVSEAALSTATQQAAWQRRPPAKRVNYSLLDTQHPFSCPYSSLLSPSPLSQQRLYVLRDSLKLSRVVDSLLRGEVEGVTLEEMDEWDCHARHAMLPVMMDCLKAAVKSYGVIMATVVTDTKTTIIDYEENIRPIIGFVEIADQSMLRGKGRGFGFISFLKLISVNSTRQLKANLFWVKNPDSRRLLPVTLTASK